MIYKDLSQYFEGRAVRSLGLAHWKKGVPSIALAIVAWYTYRNVSDKKVLERLGHRLGLPDLDSDFRSCPVNFDKVFLARLAYILKTCFPRVLCKETFILSFLTTLLFARTGMTIWISNRMAQAVSVLVSKNWTNGIFSIVYFQVVGLLAAIVNAGLKYYTTELGNAMRDRITRRVHDLYMQNMLFYKANHVGAEALEQADQLIAEDVDKLTSCAADVYANILKPVVDLLLFTVKLGSTMEVTGPIGMYCFFAIASVISYAVMPPYGRLTAQGQKKEGTFRDFEKRLINNAEMIAFVGGEGPEKKLLNESFAEIYGHTKMMATRKLWADIVMGFVNKYEASTAGFLLVCLPYYVGWKDPNTPAHEIASYYVKCAQLMEGLSDAILRLFDVQKQLGKLAGMTARVHRLIYTLEHPEVLPLPRSKVHPPEFKDGEHLKFEHVTVYKPDGRLLVKDLSFEVPRGRRIIITGENGCGKSSLFRVLRGLWPLVEGTITVPKGDSSFYFLSQANFVPIGSLRDIIIYPDTPEKMRKRGTTDGDLWKLLANTRLEDLEYNDVRPTMDTIWDWNLALSPGQKQRMAFARLLYHSPLYAVLDECTNGVAPDVEVELYEQCASRGITVFSISHKLELKKLHDYELHYTSDGKGGYQFIPLR
mmetsp:Transcript_9904/g.27816  ORF Transcript_9904/g.27816 Transcript_9904/m.27816 type:complete len:651 (-) Transcript_9904:43-1995(-)